MTVPRRSTWHWTALGALAVVALACQPEPSAAARVEPPVPRVEPPVPALPAPEAAVPRLPDPPPPVTQPPPARPPVGAPPTPPTPPRFDADRVGFGPHLNAYRRSLGLVELTHDPTLDGWCHANNEACNRDLGPSGTNLGPGNLNLHRVTNRQWFSQNAMWSPSGDPGEALAGWRSSPAHDVEMRLPHRRYYGVEYGPGPFWTLTLR